MICNKSNTARWLAGGLMAALMSTTASAAMAQTGPADRDARIQALEAQVQALAAQLAELKADSQNQVEQIADLKTSTSTQLADVRKAASATTVTLPNGRPTFATSDGQFTASLRGIVQFDAGLYDQDSAGPLATDSRRGSFNDAVENDHARDLNDGTNFRRARIGIEGKLFGAFEYNAIYDFGGSGTEEAGKITSAWLQYTLPTTQPLKVRVGAFAQPTGLEDAASNTASLFPERASIAETVRGLAGGDGRTGISLTTYGERWSAAGAFTGNVIATSTFDEQLGFVGRFSVVPAKGYDWVTHLGVNANIVVEPAAAGPDVPGGAARNVRLRDRPEFRVDGARLVDTGNIDADGVTALGLEAGGQWRNFYAQGEYFHIDVERRGGALPDPDFSGWYVQGSWIPTGGTRRYTTATAGFDGPRVAKPFDPKKSQWGEIELAARYSLIDLDYNEGGRFGPLPPGSIRGGEQSIWSLGINWYLNNAVLVSGQYRNVSVERYSPGGSAYVAGSTPPLGAEVGQDLNIWSLRTQYAF